MNDLFRFMLMRPAQPVTVAETDALAASSLAASNGQGHTTAERLAETFLTSGDVVRETVSLKYERVADTVATALSTGPRPTAEVRALVKTTTGHSADVVVRDSAFLKDRCRIADTLVATKLLSSSAGTDGPELVRLERGYDAISRCLTDDGAPLGLRVVAMPDGLLVTSSSVMLAAGNPPEGLLLTWESPETKHLNAINAAIATLQHVAAQDFSRAQQHGAPHNAPADAFALSGSPADRAAWTLRQETVAAFPTDVLATLLEAGLSPTTVPYPAMLMALENKRLSISVPTLGDAEIAVTSGGDSYMSTATLEETLVGSPASPLPLTPGNMKPVGWGDLLLVREHLKRYEGGEVAHVENVLRSEHLSRETRRLDRSEQTFVSETEATKEEQRDTQTTERFSLKRETSDTIKQESEFKAGVEVDGKYGPFIEVKANAAYATKTAAESATKQATDFSKDVVARSVSKVVERVLQRRTTTTLTEFEEKNSHGFDNTQGSKHVAGVYQWVDKVLEAQVYNYGQRLLFDFIVPEPSTAYIIAQTRSDAEGAKLKKPPPFTTRAHQLTELNYQTLALRYDATGLEAPPAPWRTFSKAWGEPSPQDPHAIVKAEVMGIDEGYCAKFARLGMSATPAYDTREQEVFNVRVGTFWGTVHHLDTDYFDMHDEVGTVPLALQSIANNTVIAIVEIFCERTARAFEQWQLKTHAAISQAYVVKQTAYERALAEAQAGAGIQVQGHNPLSNRRVIDTELRKACIALITGQQFDAFGALELSSEKYPQPNFMRAEEQGPYIRFMEQAFEWNHLAYLFYPYYWGLKKAWMQRQNLDDVDPQFADFLRAGAARVVLPVRLGFEEAVQHYLETGIVWKDGVPPSIGGKTYLPIAKEIQDAQGAPGDEKPVGKPWLVRLPTTLVKLRPNDNLPKWKKVGEDWEPDPPDDVV